MLPRLLVVSVLSLAAAACASGRYQAEGDDQPDPVDAAATQTDAAATIDAPVVPVDGPGADAPPSTVAPLQLSEVVLAPNNLELIELVNPGSVPVSLRNYYLTDVPTYFRLPAAGQTADVSDFIVRFPAGATIPARGVITIALDTTATFTAAAGVAPTYSIASGTIELVAGSSATLTNTGEPVVLFFWDGASDRVTDVDVMLAGAPSATNALVNKSGLIVDGPDAGASGTAYAVDAMTIAPQSSTPGSGMSTKRVALESASTEHQTGGNGVLGQDETSEQTTATWDTSGFTTPTPGMVPAVLTP